MSAQRHRHHGYPTQSIDPPNAKHFRGITLNRLDTFYGSKYSPYNLSSVLFAHRASGPSNVSLSVWSPGGLAKPTFEQAVRARGYVEYKVGDKLGPSWSNHWVRAELRVPKEWKGEERVQFEFDPSCEAMIWSAEGLPLQGITGGFGGDRRVEFILDEKARTNPLKIYIEVSCNQMFGNGVDGDVPDHNRYFTLNSADLVVPRMEAWRLMWDFRVLRDLAFLLPSSSPDGNRALAAATEIMNTFRTEDLSTIATCRKIAERVLGEGWEGKGEGVYTEGGEGGADAQCWGIGHCHIDTAWMWRFTQTKQKIARSWSTQVDLMNRYPEYRFSCSQAQQFKWLEQLYPSLFDVVKAKVLSGAFQPVGGTWVEMDTNMPSGEALIRQMSFGQRFFKSRFGKYCETFWLPDTFGYSAQLPQLSRLAGMKYFFTQKLSWSQFNNFPNSTFNWIGLDGSQVLTHMTPVDTYTAQATVEDVHKAVAAHKNLEQTDMGLLVFGNGDGGGGPLAPMLENLRRTRAAANNGREMPKVYMGNSVDDFFKKIDKDTNHGKTLVGWKGELYLELHRGTYTSHGSIKRHNRKSEILLRELEQAATFASLKSTGPGGYVYPKDAIDKLWEDVLLCQFHDVLPGSSIGLVYEDAEKIYAHVAEQGGKLLEQALAVLFPSSAVPSLEAVKSDNVIFGINTINRPRREVVKVEVAAQNAQVQVQKAEEDGGSFVLLEDKDGSGIARMAEPTGKVTVEQLEEGIKMTNGGLAVVIGGDGRVTSLFDIEAGREIIAKGKSAGFIIYEDRPLNWDAWDVDIFHLEKSERIYASNITVLENGPLRGTVLAEYAFGNSSIKAKISLDATPATGNEDVLSFLRFDTTVEWREQHRFLKFEAPVDIISDTAIYETQFGTISRPTHKNTTWDAAKFEVCGHKFADLSEFGYGVALINDCKYGYAVEGNVMRLSLLRSATSPDEHQDQGKHVFSFALLPHRGHFIQSDVVLAARYFNQPMAARTSPSASLSNSTFSHPKLVNLAAIPRTSSYNAVQNVVLDTVKRGDDDHFLPGPGGNNKGKTVILRVYEAYGGKGKVEIGTSASVRRAVICDTLERDIEPVDVDERDGITFVKLDLGAFQVLSLKLHIDDSWLDGQSATKAATQAKGKYRPAYLSHGDVNVQQRAVESDTSGDEAWEHLAAAEYC